MGSNLYSDEEKARRESLKQPIHDALHSAAPELDGDLVFRLSNAVIDLPIQLVPETPKEVEVAPV